MRTARVAALAKEASHGLLKDRAAKANCYGSPPVLPACALELQLIPHTDMQSIAVDVNADVLRINPEWHPDLQGRICCTLCSTGNHRSHDFHSMEGHWQRPCPVPELDKACKRSIPMEKSVAMLR